MTGKCSYVTCYSSLVKAILPGLIYVIHLNSKIKNRNNFLAQTYFFFTFKLTLFIAFFIIITTMDASKELQVGTLFFDRLFKAF